LRVLFISLYNPFGSSYGGGTHLRYLSQGLAELGCEVHILMADNSCPECTSNITMHTLNIPKIVGYGAFFSLFSIKKIFDICEKHKIDVVHSQSPSGAGYALFGGNRAPFVVTLHSTSFGQMACSLRSPISSGYASFLYHNVFNQLLGAGLTTIECKRAKKVITISEYLAKEVRSYYKLPESKVVVIPNGVAEEQLRLSGKKLHKTNEKTILYVGRLIDIKGIDHLLDAMPRVLSLYPEAKLKIVGDGPWKEILIRQAKDQGIDHAVEFVGEVPHDAVFSYYSEADLVVQPSKYECGGLAVAEAMIIGTPVIATYVGGLPEIIKNYENGILVAPGNSSELADAILKVLSNPALGSRLGANAEKSIREKFTWKQHCKRTLEIYEELI
jgi:glycogen(starch) synthase